MRKCKLSKSARKLKRLRSATVTRVALCQRGKNGFRTIFKSDGSVELSTLVKTDNLDQGELLAVVYAPDIPDSDGDFADAAVIKSMQRGYMRDHQELDIEHDGKALKKSQAYIAESFIVAKGDERFQDWKTYDDEPAGDLTGAWAMILQIDDPAIRKSFREEGWNGVSLFGTAAVERVDPKAASKRVAEHLSAALGKKDIDMDKEELKALFKSFLEDLSAKLTPPKKETEVVKSQLTMPTFDGDPTNPADLEKFEGDVRRYELAKAMQEGKLTSKQIAEMRAELAETQPSDEEAGIEKSDSPEVRKLKKALFNAKKKTNAPQSKVKKSKTEDADDEGDEDEDEDDDGDDDEASLQKSRLKEGSKIRGILNARRGFPSK